MSGESSPPDIAADWQLSEVSGQPESPKLHWLLDRLAALAGPDAERKLICHHAYQIHVEALMLAAGQGLTTAGKQSLRGAAGLERMAHKIKVSGNTGYSAKPIKSDTRSAEFKRLERAAKSGSLKRWLAAWAGASHGTLNLVTSGLSLPTADLPLSSRVIPKSWIPVHAPGMHMTVPPAIEALPAILAARKKHQAIPGAERKKRVREPDMEDFIALTKRAFFELTGRRAGVTRNPFLDIYSGAYYELIRDIDARYKTGIIPRKKPTKILRKINRTTGR